MEIRYTDHATVRMWERGISKESVRRALRRGRREQEFDQSENVIKCSYDTNGKRLVVVCQLIGHDKYLIVTAYYER